MTRFALKGSTILSPGGPQVDHAVLVEGAKICEVVRHQDIPTEFETVEFDGATLTPGLLDVQVNGGGGHLFNNDPTAATIAALGECHRQHGTTGFLPTLISDSFDKMQQAWDGACEAIAKKVPGCLGLHLEGPFLNEVRKGIHNAEHFRALDDKALALLTREFPGKLLITLAPEQVHLDAIRALREAGVIVAAGHTTASYRQAKDAIAAGVTGFTHLFNAMPPLLSREPGTVAAALESPAWCSMIVDGHHVDPAMMRLAYRAKADKRLMLVTDAMAAAGTDTSEFTFDGKTIRIDDGRCTDEAGTLAGSNLTMGRAVHNATTMMGLSLEQAVCMGATEPARFLGLDDQRGTLAPGKIADIAIFWPNKAKITTIVDGDLSFARGF